MRIECAPELVLLMFGMGMLVAECLGRPKPLTLAAVSFTAYGSAAVCLLLRGEHAGLYWSGVMRVDGLASWGSLLVIGAGAWFALAAREYQHRLPMARGEFFLLPVVASSILCWAVSASDLVALWVALELAGLLAVILLAYQRNQAGAIEAGMKFLVVNAASAAVLGLAVAFVLAQAGTTQLDLLNVALQREEDRSWVPLAAALLVLGLGAKLFVAPLHWAVPDALEGAPSPVSAWVATVLPLAAVIALMRLMELPWMGAGAGSDAAALGLWQPLLFVLACLSLGVGTLVALPQRNLKRLFAYLVVAQGGAILLTLATMQVALVSVALLQLVATGVSLSVGFLVISAVAWDRKGEAIDQFAGLGRRDPVLGGALMIAFGSLAGLPGTWGAQLRWEQWCLLWQGDHWALVLLLVGVSWVTLAPAITLARVLFIAQPVGTRSIQVRGSSRGALVLGSCLLLWGFVAGSAWVLLAQAAVGK